VLFLSFARATVARVTEQAGEIISGEDGSRLEINTYHGFAWKLLRSHGYLLKGSQRIRLLPPPEAASRLAEVEGDTLRTQEKNRLFREEGLLHFDLFASTCAELQAFAKTFSGTDRQRSQFLEFDVTRLQLPCDANARHARGELRHRCQ
jgi:superfamily I DNA/RNA helicase